MFVAATRVVPVPVGNAFRHRYVRPSSCELTVIFLACIDPGASTVKPPVVIVVPLILPPLIEPNEDIDIVAVIVPAVI
jgi:hypothetical protein